jgi:hypothetical protein
MSRLWSFYSYSQPRFDAYFGGGQPGAARQVVEAVTWDEDAWDDLDLTRRLAERIVAEGIRYAGLSPTETETLDCLIPMLFAPEGLAEPLEVVPKSPDGLHPSVAQELLSAGRPGDGPVLLPVLLGGRRYGAAEGSGGAYCFLSVDESGRLMSEAERALAAGGPWSQPWIPQVVRDYLLGPLRSAVSEGRPVFGVLD